MKKTLIGTAAAVTLGLGSFMYINTSLDKTESSASDKTENSTSENLEATPKIELVQDSEIIEKDIKTVTSQADFSVSYENIEELVAVSETIIEGKVLSTEPFLHKATENNNVAYTKVKLKVTKSYTDDVQPGDTVVFAEPGGTATMEQLGKAEKLKDQPKEALKQKVKIVFGGVPNMKPNEKYLLFGKSTNFFEEEMYITAGAYQGKFIINDNKYKRTIPKGESKYKTLESTATEVDTKIKKLLKEKQK